MEERYFVESGDFSKGYLLLKLEKDSPSIIAVYNYRTNQWDNGTNGDYSEWLFQNAGSIYYGEPDIDEITKEQAEKLIASLNN